MIRIVTRDEWCCRWLMVGEGLGVVLIMGLGLLSLGLVSCDLFDIAYKKRRSIERRVADEKLKAEREQDIYMATIADTDLIDPLKDALNRGAMEDGDEQETNDERIIREMIEDSDLKANQGVHQ